MQVCIWKRNPLSNTELIMKGECYIFLVHLLNVSVQNIESGYITKKTDIESDLWLEGKDIGKIYTTFIVQHLPYLKQKIAGVLTEKGHKKSAPAIMGKTNNANVKELVRLSNDLKNLYFQKDNSYEHHRSTIEYNIKNRLGAIREILVESDKVSSQIFIYKTMDEMIRTQQLLLEIGKLLCSSYEKLDPSMEEVFFSCITQLLKRGEFDLSSLCFEEGLTKKQLELKKKVGLNYQRLLYKLLDNIFNDLEQKGLTINQRSFIEFFLAYVYFRIPEFRTELLIVLDNKDIKLSDVHKENKEIESILLDWGKDFYAYIETEEKYLLNLDILNRALKKNWREKFQKKGIIFFYFLIEWCNYVRKTLVVKNFSWENIQGYEILISTFLEQLKVRDVNKYPDVLINASTAVLANPNILDPMVKTLIVKTK